MSDAYTKQLEDENARLRSQLARAGVAPLLSADLPTDEQAAALLRLVVSAHPVLKPDDGGEFNLHHQFSSAMRWAAYARRRRVRFGITGQVWLGDDGQNRTFCSQNVLKSAVNSAGDG